MRFLHVNAGNLFGGIEVLIATLARHRDICPDLAMELAVCFPGRIRGEMQALGVPVHVLGPARISRPWTLWRVRAAMRRLLAARPFDAVICHGTWAQGIFGAAIRAAGVASVLWQHDAPPGTMNWVDRWASWSPPELIICNSDYTRLGTARVYPRVRAETVFCPVTIPTCCLGPEDRAQIRTEFGTPTETVVILQVGRWEPHKGHLFHIQALAKLAELPGWECWQVGGAQRSSEEAYLATVQRESARCGIADRVRFLGYQANIERLMHAADIYCQPNVSPEPFGITFIEALHAGLPVVATPLGGPKETIDETCGVLVTPGDVAGLAGVLRCLIESPEQRQRLGYGGPARARAIADPDVQMPALARLLTPLVRHVRPSHAMQS
jgi:glycosyltransferase involved in cell wall biosynthesis